MERHLAAILSADVAGYSQLMQRDEVGTLAALKKIRADIFAPRIQAYRGRSIKLLGDGELMEFPSIVDAVTCAVEIQLAMMQRNRGLPDGKQIWFRIGINIGDVIVDDNDIYGDGVNLASRVEHIAERGGIALTNLARNQIINQVDLDFNDLGMAEIKGFDKPIQVFSVVLDGKAETHVAAMRSSMAGNGGKRRSGWEPWTPRSRREIARFIAGLSAALYLIAGAFQVYGDGGRISASNLFCPILSTFAEKQPTMLLGVVLPLEESHGKRMEWGIRKAISENRDSYPFPIDLVLLDSSNGPDTVKAGLADFTARGVKAVIGPMNSDNAYHAKVWGNRTHVPVVSPLATASYLTNPDSRDFFFRTTMSDGARAKTLVDWVTLKGKLNNPYILHEWAPRDKGDSPEIYGASQATAVKRYLGSADTIRFTRNDEASLIAAADRVQNNDRAVMIFGYSSNIKIIINSMQQRGVMNDIFLMGVVTKTLEEANFPYPEKLHVVTPDITEASRISESAQLRREFEDDNPDIEYDISAYYAYDTVTIVLDAEEAAREDACAGRADGDLLAAALRNTPNKRRKIFNGGFMNDEQEVFFRFDGLKIINGRFRHVGIGL
ncbi:MAG: ABC transporter substrate-binding protein [Nitratireductor sp.]|nr:ABC transporter substrate-binding protein [Nitratireductor sp.]